MTALLGALVSATLTRSAPGFGVRESDLDPRVNHDSLDATRTVRPPRSVIGYVAGLCRGNLGQSTTFERPVLELIRERARPTGLLLLAGLSGAWLLALLLGAGAAVASAAAWDFGISTAAGLCLCTPAGAAALVLFMLGGPPVLGMILLVFPHLFQYVRNTLRKIVAAPHVLSARARGVSNLGVLWRYALPAAAPQLAALAATSVTVAVGAAIPLEALCDVPGLGQLFWKCALARDVDVVVNLTALIAVALQILNRFAELLAPRVSV